MEPKAMGFEIKVKTICALLIYPRQHESQYFGIRWNWLWDKPDVTTNHGAVTNSDPP